MVSVNRTFQSEEEARSFLLKNLPLELEKSGDIFIIIPNSEDTVIAQPKAVTQITGQVMEAQTYEPLPFSYISVNNKSIQSDQQGNFNFIASADSTFDLRISHLEYYIYDTIITQSINKKRISMKQHCAIYYIGKSCKPMTLTSNNNIKIKNVV